MPRGRTGEHLNLRTAAMSRETTQCERRAVAGWVEALWPWLENDLRHPISVEQRRDCTRIEILGALRIKLADDHTQFRLLAREAAGFTHADGADLRLRTPLASDLWMRHWLWRRAHRCERPVGELGAIAERVIAGLRERLTSTHVWNARALIRAGLPLDADTLRLAERTFCMQPLSLRGYCQSMRFRDDLLARQPSMLGVLGMSVHFAMPGDLGRFRNVLMGYGLTRAGWRALHRHGDALWRPLRRTHEYPRARHAMALGWANIVALLPGTCLPPARIALAWARTFSMRPDCEAVDAGQQARLIHAACMRWHRLATRREQRGFARNELMQVLEWSHFHAKRPPTAPAGAGWNWYLRQVRASEWERLAKRIQKRSPGAADRSREFEGIRFLQINSQASLFRTGLRFRNCLARIPIDGLRDENCDGYHALIDPVTDRPIALLRTEGNRARIAELRGPCNQPVSSRIMGIAQRYLQEGRGES